MLWKIFLATFSFLVSPFRAPTEIPYVATPTGPQNWNEALKAMEALHGPGDDMRFGPDQPSWKKMVEPVFKKAAAQYAKNTCIRFVERTTQTAYVFVINDMGKCYSYLGRQGKRQTMSLGDGCLFTGTVVHEMGHALSFCHEHQRSDRDKYLNVYEKNVIQGERHNFYKYNASEEAFRQKYDYASIMHYGEYAFSKIPGSLKTMEAKNGTPLKEPFDRPGLNQNDIDMINKLYKCKI
ncbi:astacin [Caerostris extrusa]|uniref:Metalloendopeptidase n=1 Tax=Caerostris extrusa TaxID=172846 RepID=A0AAV4STE6_CAEEX|nr:astacin [Caerostris extrusa]